MAIRFIAPTVHRPTGGVNVMIEMAEVLTRAGAKTEILGGKRGYVYPHAGSGPRPFTYDPRLIDVMAYTDKPGKFKRAFRRWAVRRAVGRAVANAADVIVFPEYNYPELAPRFAAVRRVLLVQDAMAFARAFARDGAGALGLFDAILCTSDASHATVDAAGVAGARRVTLNVGRAGMAYREAKARRIAYFPRKRPQEAQFLASVLGAAPEAAGFEISDLTGLDNAALVDAMGEALVFLAFSSQEGFGLPPAEALLSGCLVVGYDGVGGAEYFDVDAAYRVPDGDIAAFARTVRTLLQDYDGNPERFDRYRRASSAAIAERYSAERFAESVLAAFHGFLA